MAGVRSTLAVGLLAAGCADEAQVHLFEPADQSVKLVHRYDFEGRGTTLADRAGDADGEILGGAALDESGVLKLDGIDDYVNLPNDILGDSSGVSLVAWVTWSSSPSPADRERCWERIFDLGRSAAGEDIANTATSSIFVTPATCNESHVGPVEAGVLSTMFHAGQAAQVGQDTEPLPFDRIVQVALTLDAAEGLKLYLDGELLVTLAGETDPRLIECDNDWLGRSQWRHDPLFSGSFDEFRVYEGVLSSEDVADLFDRGQDSP